MLVNLLKSILQLDELQRTYERSAADRGDRNIFATLMEILDIHHVVTDQDRQRIPRSGPLVVISNHPTGAMDAILLNAFLLSIREDCRILAHVWFQRFEDLARHMVFVDPSAGSPRRQNVLAMRAATEWLERGGLLVVNPSASVSCFQPKKREVTDLPWRPGLAKILLRTRADVLPVFIEGRNSFLFQVLSSIHPRAGTPLLARELFNKRGQTLRMRVGRPIPFAELPGSGSGEAITQYLRNTTYQLEASR